MEEWSDAGGKADARSDSYMEGYKQAENAEALPSEEGALPSHKSEVESQEDHSPAGNGEGAPVNVGSVKDGRDLKDFKDEASEAVRADGVVGRSLTDVEASDVISRMGTLAEEAPQLELTPENWLEQFGEDGKVETPIGEVKMGENQFIKLFSRKRAEYFGMIKPTLTAPDVILEETDPKDGAERDSKYLFIKSFVKPDGGRIIHFESVTVRKDGMEVSISSHEIKDSAIKNKMQNDRILHLEKKLSLSSEGRLTETPSESEGPDLVPTSDNISSGDKGSENKGSGQEAVVSELEKREAEARVLLGEELESLGDDESAQFMAALEQDPEGMLKKVYDESLRRVCEEWVNARAALAGARQRVADRKAEELEAAKGTAERLKASGSEAYGRFEAGTPQEQAEARAEMEDIEQRCREALEGIEDAFGADAEARMAEIEENPLDLLDDPELTVDQQEAVLYYINARAALEGVQAAADESAESKRKAVTKAVEDRTHKDAGAVIPATMKVDDRQVYIVKRNVRMFEDGSGVDVRNSDQSVVVFDPQKGKLEVASPEKIYKVGEARDPQAELEAALAEVEAQRADALPGQALPSQKSEVKSQEDHSPAGNGEGAEPVGDFKDGRDLKGFKDETSEAVEAVGVVGRSLTETEASDVISRMGSLAEEAPQLELTPENWLEQFGEDGKVETPIGEVKMGENQFIKLFSRKRAEYFGMIKPTLTDPDVVIEKKAAAYGAERNTKLLFVKTFVKPDGGRIVHFESITVRRDGMEVSISSHEAEAKDLKKDMQKEKILHISKALSPSSEWSLTEAPSESEGPDLVPTSDNISSGDKGSEKVADVQAEAKSALMRVPVDGQGRPLFAQAESAALGWDALVEKTGGSEEKAQAFAQMQVKRMEAAVKKAERVKVKETDDVDAFLAADAEREAAIERARGELASWKAIAGEQSRRRAQEEAEARAQEEAERAAEAEWQQSKRRLDKRLRETAEEYRDVPEVMEILENMDPQSVDEIAAMVLSGSKVLWGNSEKDGRKLKVGARHHVGIGEGERRKLFGLFASEANGGLSIERLAEDRFAVLCDIYGVRYDNGEALDALIDVIRGASTYGDIRNYIANKRIMQARREGDAIREHERADAEAYYEEVYGMSPEEYEGYVEQLEAGCAQVSAEDIAELERIIAEEYFENGKEYDDRKDEDAPAGGDALLQGREVDEHGGGGASEGEEPGPLRGGSDGAGGAAQAAEASQESRVKSQKGDADRLIGWDEPGPKENPFLKVGAESSKVVASQSQESGVKSQSAELTEAQKQAGNYKMEHRRVDGYDISIENKKGSVRRGKDANGTEWESEMHNDYGYIRGTEGVDGDHIDVFLSDTPEQGDVFVVDQYNPDGSFDEHKVMYGFADGRAAMDAYLANYEQGWEQTRRLDVTGVSKDEFKKWIQSSKRKTKPFAEYANIRKEASASSQDSNVSDDKAKTLSSVKQEDGVGKGETKVSVGEDAEANREVYEAAKGLVEATGMKVHEVSEEEAQAMLGEKVQLSAAKRRALDTLNGGSALQSNEAGSGSKDHQGSVTTFDTAAKIQLNLEKLASKYDKISNASEKTICGELSKALGLRNNGNYSNYGTFEAKNGSVVRIRVSDHNAQVKNFDDAGYDNGISIVVTRKANEGLDNNGEAHIVEYYYNGYKLAKADGHPLAEIARSLQQVLYSGEFRDTTGLAERQEVNGAEVRFLRTPDGRVYGWTRGGEVWLNRDAMSPETPLHEYTHPWDEMVRRENPELWERGKELMKQTPLWDDVMSDPAYADIRDDEDAVASEVHSRLTGERGAKVLERMIEDARKDGPLAEAEAVTLVAKLRRWLRDMFAGLKKTLGKWSDKDLQDLAAEEFADMTLRDLAEGMNPVVEMRRGEVARVVTEANPMLDDYHRGVRGREDVMTFDEVLSEAEKAWEEYGDLTYPDMDIEMLRQAKEDGVITVYSSKPIDAGVFVTPSRMNAEDYAGGGRVYEKLVGVDEVAWTGEDEGQYAPVASEKGDGAGVRLHAAMSSGKGRRRRGTAAGRSLFDWADENERRARKDSERDEQTLAAELADEAIDRYAADYLGYLEASEELEKKISELKEGSDERRDAEESLDHEEVRIIESRDALEQSLREYYGRNNTADDASRIARDMAARVQAEVEVRRNGKALLEDILGRDGNDVTATETTVSDKELKTAGGSISYNAVGHLPDAKAGEFAYVERKFTRSGAVDFTGSERLRDRGDVAYMFRALEDYSIEHVFGVLVKDGRAHVLHIGMGGPTGSVAYMGALRAAYDAFGADKIYLVHNHPSGNLKASVADQRLMKTLEEAFDGVATEGLIVDTTSGRYGTFDGNGNMESHERPREGGDSTANVLRFDRADQYMERGERRVITSPQDVSEFISRQRFSGGNKVSYIVLSHSNEIIGNFHTDYDTVDDELAAEIVSTATKFGGSRVVLYGRGAEMEKSADLKRNMEKLSLGTIGLLDLVEVNGEVTRSAMDHGYIRDGGEKYGSQDGREDRGTVMRRNTGWDESTPVEVSAKRARIEKLRRSKPVVVTNETIPTDTDLSDRKSVKEALKKVIRGTYINEDTGESISVFKDGINEVTSHGMTNDAHVQSLFAIPDMLKKSIFIEEKTNEKTHTDFEKYRYYVCGLKIDGEDYTAKIVVGVRGNNRYYDHRLSQIEKGKLIDSLNGLSNSEAKNESPDLGYKGTTLESLLQVKEEDIQYRYRDGGLGLEEAITKMKVEAAQANSDNLQAKRDAMKAIGGNLSHLRQAMARQREYDLTTVKSISDLAKTLLDAGLLDDLSKSETKRILGTINNVVGKQDVSQYVEKVMDIMVDNQLRMGANIFGKLLTIKGSRVDARGIEVQGELDPEGVAVAKVVRKSTSLPKDEIDNLIADAIDRMSSTDTAIADEAAIEYAGLLLARQFVENVTESKAEEKALRESIRQAKTDKDAGQMNDAAYKQYVEATEEAIRQNKIERAEAYRELAEQVGGVLSESVERARAWREAEKQRVEEIHHNANSDMEGRPANEHHKPDRVQKLANNSLVRFVLAPLGTFDQMLRMFGKKNARGEGYLWNRFMRGWLEATEREYTGYRDALKRLDEKVSEVYGKKMKWGDLFAVDRKLPNATVSFMDGGEMKEHELTQGNLLYIYMADKMSDGRMKLRKMGITEEKIEEIKNFLDPHFLELADWMQEEFLMGKRNEYNEVHKRMFGASMAAIENYFPLKILANARLEEVDVAEDTADTALPATSTGSIIKRRRNSLALDVTGANAFSVILDHLQQMERWAAFAEFNRDLNTLLSYKRFRTQVMNMSSVYGGGKTLWNNFRNVCSMAAGAYRPPIAALDKAAVNIARCMDEFLISEYVVRCSLWIVGIEGQLFDSYTFV